MKRCSHSDGGHNGLFTDAKQYDESVGSSPPSSASTYPKDWDRRSGRTIRWTE